MSRMLKLTLAVAIVAARAHAQDVMVVARPHYKVLAENEFVRVVENTLQPGEKDPLHSHPAGWTYVTRPGKMKVVFADGRVVLWEPKAGESEWGEAEAPHTSENVGTTPMSYVLVEVKPAAHAAAAAAHAKSSTLRDR